MAKTVVRRAGGSVEIEGLSALRRGLGKADAVFAQELKAAGKAAAELVVREATRRAPVGKRKRKGHSPGLLKKSIRALGSAKGGVIAAGGARVPYIFLQEFGGSVRKRGAGSTALSAAQTRGRRGLVSGGKLIRARVNYGYGANGLFLTSQETYARRVAKSGRILVKTPRHGGYFIYPAIAAKRQAVIEQYGKAVDDAIDAAAGRGDT